MTAPQAHRGGGLGLPASGPGSLAPTGQRLFAFVVDAIASSLVAALFGARSRTGSSFADRLPGSWAFLPLAVDYVVGSLVAGRTLGMYLFGLRLIPLRLVRSGQPVGIDVVRAVVRTALLFLLVPALVVDRDGRGLQDRLTDTAVVRA